MATRPANAEIQRLLEENRKLKEYIKSLESDGNGTVDAVSARRGDLPEKNAPYWDRYLHGLSREQISRYSRQIVLPSFGIRSQSRLCQGSVLVIGAGGLGSPALLYLAAAGVGRIGIVDQDVVELSNIHRQIIHTEATVGVHKADSAAKAIRALNSSVHLEVFREGFSPKNALDITKGFDVVIDATDNAPSRYLVSDACAVSNIPLVSGASIGTDGQLTVYCYGEDGPCYRCLFPTAPAPQSCARCVDAGVLGVLPGIIGTMQALEAIKIICKVGEPMSRRLLLLDGLSGRYQTVRLRSKRPECVACGEKREITGTSLPGYDYEAFTGQLPNDAAPGPLTLIARSDRITPAELKRRIYETSEMMPLVVDVRSSEQFHIGSLPGAISAPWRQFDEHVESIELHKAMVEANVVGTRKQVDVFVVCRRGNDSQRAVSRLRELGLTTATDMIGGMEAWARDVDPTFPLY